MNVKCINFIIFNFNNGFSGYDQCGFNFTFFMAVLTNPSVVETNVILNKMFQISKLFGIENNDQFLYFFWVLLFLFY